MELSISFGNPLPSQFALGETVAVELQKLQLEAQVIAVAFVEGKVLYTVAIYTGFTELELASQYGLTNSVGWDENGREFVRLQNIDSIFIKPFNPLPTLLVGGSDGTVY
jgi:hypothetical protein